jgi:hypothetical protein
MEYPHIKYIRYLVTKKYSSLEIQEECLRLSLLVPLEEDIVKIESGVGAFPSSWDSIYNKKNAYLIKWLRKRGVLDLWQSKDIIRKATNLLYRSSVRKDFETLLLATGSISDSREQLLLKYNDPLVPELEVLNKYYDIFWNVGGMSKDGLYEFLSRNSDKEAKLAALDGNIAEAYARAGLTHQISSAQFYNNIVSLANHQVQLARMSGEMLSGSSLMGIAAISRQAIDAIRSRDELMSDNTVDVLDTIREQASTFTIKKLHEEEVLTIEQLEDINGQPKLQIVRD